MRNLKYLLFSVTGLIFCVSFTVGYDPATCIRCRETHLCNPPDCFCCRDTMPLANQHKIPQMVFFTFDDAVTPAVAKHYRDLFDPSRKNPNGCPISMTLFVSHSNTVYRLVREFHEKGIEIGSHSVTHSHPNSDTFIQEARAQKENLAKKAKIPVEEISGWRSPFLEPLGDTQPSVLKELGYEYDATLTMIKKHSSDPAITPFTLDHGWPYDCKIKPCPRQAHKGFWEVPVVSVKDYLNKYDCVYVDGCNNPPPSEETAFQFLWDNFQTYYASNRAPFGINMHASWFFYEHRKAGMNRFIQELVKLDDVYIISVKQVLEWLKNPTPLNQILSFQPWSCNSKNHTAVNQAPNTNLERKIKHEKTENTRLQRMRKQQQQRQERQQIRRQQRKPVRNSPQSQSPTRQPVSIPSVQRTQQSWQQQRMNPVPPVVSNVPNVPRVRFWWRQPDMMMQRQMERRRNIQIQQQQQRLEQERRLAQERRAEQQRQQDLARQRQVKLKRQQDMERQRQNELDKKRQREQQRLQKQRLEQQRLEEIQRKQQIEKQRQEEVKRKQQIEQQKQQEIQRQQQFELQRQEEQKRLELERIRQQQIEQQEQAELKRQKLVRERQQIEQQKQTELKRKEMEQRKQNELQRQQQIAQQQQKELRRVDAEQQRLELLQREEFMKAQELEKRRRHELAMLQQNEFENQRVEDVKQQEIATQMTMDRMRIDEINQKEQRRIKDIKMPQTLATKQSIIENAYNTHEPNHQTPVDISANIHLQENVEKQTFPPKQETTKSFNLADILAEDPSSRIQRLESLSLAELQILQEELQRRLQQDSQTTQMPAKTATTILEQFENSLLPLSTEPRTPNQNPSNPIPESQKKEQQQLIINSEQYLGPILPPPDGFTIDIKPVENFNKVVLPGEFNKVNDVKISRINTKNNTMDIIPTMSPQNRTNNGDIGIEPSPRINVLEITLSSETKNELQSVPSVDATSAATTTRQKVPALDVHGTRTHIVSKPMWQLDSGDIEKLHMPWTSLRIPQTPTGTVLFSSVSKDAQNNAGISKAILTTKKNKPPTAVNLFTPNDFTKSIPIISPSESPKTDDLILTGTLSPVAMSSSTPVAFAWSGAPVAIGTDAVLPTQASKTIQSQHTTTREQPAIIDSRHKNNKSTTKISVLGSVPRHMFTIPKIVESTSNMDSTAQSSHVPSSSADLVSAQPTTSLIPRCRQGENCFAPQCACKSATPPENMAVSDVPQIVYITIDGSLNFHSYSKINSLFSPKRLNPNGCRIKGTLFVTDAGSSYRIANVLHSEGIEIATSGLNTRPHRNIASMKTSMAQQRDRISRSSNIASGEIRGWRSPGFKVLGDGQFDLLANYSAYDSSIVLDRSGKDHAKVWPFTLDFGVGEQCVVGQCPSSVHPGVWEVPVIPFVGPDNSSNCEYTDGCTRQPATEQETIDYLTENFNHHYKSNRAPFAMRLKQIWFHWFYRDNLSALIKFLDTILGYGDVYVTSIKDMIEYIERPLPLRDISQFEPWKC